MVAVGFTLTGAARLSHTPLHCHTSFVSSVPQHENQRGQRVCNGGRVQLKQEARPSRQTAQFPNFPRCMVMLVLLPGVCMQQRRKRVQNSCRWSNEKESEMRLAKIALKKQQRGNALAMRPDQGIRDSNTRWERTPRSENKV
jgi:hypothetical protein